MQCLIDLHKPIVAHEVVNNSATRVRQAPSVRREEPHPLN